MNNNRELVTDNRPLLDRINDVWEQLLKDPAEFGKLLYDRVNKRLYSPIINTNNPNVCCILNSTGYTYERNYSETSELGYCPIELEYVDSIVPRSKYTFPYKAILPNGATFYILVRRFNKAYAKFGTRAIGSKKGVSSPTIDVCLPRLQGKNSFLRCDPFTNDYLIGMLLKYFTTISDGPSKHIVSYRDAAICSKEEGTDEGNLLGVTMIQGRQVGTLADIRSIGEEFNDLRTVVNYARSVTDVLNLNVLNLATCQGIINQLLYTYIELQRKAMFRHNHAYAGNMMVSREPVQNQWEGINIQSEITVRITNFANAQASLPLDEQNANLRLYSAGTVSKILQVIAPFQPKVGKQGIDPYFMLSGATIEGILTDVRHTGLPFYAAFDIYTFMVSLFMIPDFWIHVNTNDSFRAAYWEPMWFLDEQEKMRKRIGEAVKKRASPSYYNIVRLLSGVKMICTVGNKLVNQIRKVSIE